jgi:hypothetical protein
MAEAPSNLISVATRRTSVQHSRGSQSEGAISKHEPFNLQTATETNEPTRFVRALSDGFALVCQPGWGIHGLPLGGHDRTGP